MIDGKATGYRLNLDIGLVSYQTNVYPISDPSCSGVQKSVTESLTMELRGKENEFPLVHYKIDKHLGFGGQGIVLQYSRFNSFHAHLPESVAVKTIPESKAKWSRELEIMSLVVENPHPNLVKCYGFCQVQEGEIGIVMELHDMDLFQYLSKKTSPLTVKETKGIVYQLAAALNHLKKYDIVHRDIKPENILVKVHQSGEIQVTITDLGRCA